MHPISFLIQLYQGALPIYLPVYLALALITVKTYWKGHVQYLGKCIWYCEANLVPVHILCFFLVTFLEFLINVDLGVNDMAKDIAMIYSFLFKLTFQSTF